jgi:hypothetical protein
MPHSRFTKRFLMTTMAEANPPADSQASSPTTDADAGDDTDTETTTDTDPLLTRLRAGTHSPPFPGTAQKACPHCDSGVIWHNSGNDETMCDSCYRAPMPARPHITPDSVTGYQREADCYQRDTYIHSDRTRLVGGYTRAYDTTNGDDYGLEGSDFRELAATPNADGWHRSGRVTR